MYMSKYKVIARYIVFAVATFCAFSQEHMPREIENQQIEADMQTRKVPSVDLGDAHLQPEHIISIEQYKSSITVRTNVYNAAVYLNGTYQGTSPCTINNLAPGMYLLRVEKRGYDSRSYYIQVRRNQNNTFFVELEKTTGFILLTNIPDNSTVTVNGSIISQYAVLTGASPLEVDEGYHTVSVRKFGFENYSTHVYVSRRTVTSVAVQMIPAAFSISNFTASKKRFNPMYDGALGSCIFSFDVSAPESSILTITDEYGTVVCTYQFPQFTTWSQRFSWNGRDAYGNVLPDGAYSATITSGTYTHTAYTKIDSTLVYHPIDITKSGSGIGSLPTAFMLGERTTFLGIQVQPTFTKNNPLHKNDEPFYEIPINLFFGMTPTSWFEFMLHFGIHAGIQSVPLSFNAAFKFGSSVPLKKANICFTALIRYGYQSQQSLYAPSNADIGNGLGTGIALGFDAVKLYAGISSEFIYSALRGNFETNDSIWRNGIAIEFRPIERIALKAWGALNSSVLGTSGNNWLSALDTGGSISMRLGNSSAILSLRGNALVYFNDATYASGTVGVTYFF